MTTRLEPASPVTRRGFLAFGAASALSALGRQGSSARAQAQGADSAEGPPPVGRLWDPARAGRPLPPVTAADNDAAIQAIEKQIHCTCGCNLDVYTCRTTDFTCTVSPALHQHVLALAGQGLSGPEIIEQFVREHGVAILMAPPKRGFNLLGYLLPPVATVIGAGILLVVLRRWTAGPGPGRVPPAADPGATPEELERLRRELDRLSV